MKIETTPQFERALKALKKRYRNIVTNLEPLFTQLRAGQVPGDKIQHANFDVYKVRLKNIDAGKGKSGGYRVIYYVRLKK